MKPEAPLQWHDTNHVTKTLQRVYKILRGNISFGSTFDPADKSRNIDAYPATAKTPAVAATEFAIIHGLNRVPIGFHLVSKDGQTDVWNSTTPWTTSTIFLKASGLNVNITVLIF